MKTTGIYIARGDDTLGPYSALEAAERIERGDLRPNDFAARNGDAAWVPLSVLLAPEVAPPATPEIRAAAGPQPVPEPRAAKAAPTPEARPAKHEPTPEIPAEPVTKIRSAISTPSREVRRSPVTPVTEVRAARFGSRAEARPATVIPAAKVQPVVPASAAQASPAAPVAAPKAQPANPAPMTSENQRVAPSQNPPWSRLRALVILLSALLAGSALLAVRWLTHQPASHQVAQAKPAPTVALPPRPLVKATPAPVVTRPNPSPVVETTPAPKVQSAPPVVRVSPTPEVAGLALATPENSRAPMVAASTTPVPSVTLPVPSPPEEKRIALHGVVSLGAPRSATVRLAGVRVSAYPLAALAPTLASRQAQVETELARLTPQIAAAEAERTTRAADERAAQQALYDAPPNGLRSSLRFAYEQAKVAVKAAEADYRYLLDQRREQMDGENYFRDLPPAVATTETDADGKFSLELPPGGPFAVAASARRMTAEGPQIDYWLVKIPLSEGARQTFSLSRDNVASSGSADSLIRTAD